MSVGGWQLGGRRRRPLLLSSSLPCPDVRYRYFLSLLALRGQRQTDRREEIPPTEQDILVCPCG